MSDQSNTVRPRILTRDFTSTDKCFVPIDHSSVYRRASASLMCNCILSVFYGALEILSVCLIFHVHVSVRLILHIPEGQISDLYGTVHLV